VCPCWPINGERKPLHCSGWVALAPIQSEHGLVLYVLAYRVHDPREGCCFEGVPHSNELLGNLVAEDAAVIYVCGNTKKRCTSGGNAMTMTLPSPSSCKLKGIISQVSWWFRCPDVAAIRQSLWVW